MVSSEVFERELQDALVGLYDLHFQPGETFCTVTGYDPQDGTLGVQPAVTRIIEAMAPPDSAPGGAYTRRIYDVLYNRYVQKLTQEETAERLHLSVSSVRRAQREAVHALASRLWEHYRARATAGGGLQRPPVLGPASEATPDHKQTGWRSQVKTDIASLQRDAPGIVADVGATVRSAVGLETVVASTVGIRLEVAPASAGLVTTLHPSVLRQIVVMAISSFLHHGLSGEVTIRAKREDGRIRLSVAGPFPREAQPSNLDLMQEIMASQGGSVRITRDAGMLAFLLEMPSAGNITVLVVDDNPDMVYFYRRCTEGTQYQIVHEARGARVLEAIDAHHPNVIVLDIMLPDVDGWALLSHLYERPETRATPVVVCSVIREESLAMALGAVAFLPKPVDYRRFIQVLDRAVENAPRAVSGVQESNGPPG